METIYVQPTQEMSATSLLKLFETTKEQRESFVVDLVNRIDTGEVNPLEVHLQMKSIEDIVKLSNSNSVYKAAVLAEAEKHGQKSFQFHNAKVEIKETGVKYDFSKCEDVVLNRMYAEQAALDAKIKARETMLKATDIKGMTVVDEETGEGFTVFPPAKSSTTNVAITLK